MNLTIGFVTFNNIKYTKLCVQSFKETVKTPFKFFVVDGGSKDETVSWLKSQDIPHRVHGKNFGSCVGVNDIFDQALKEPGDYLLLCGNDVMAYPGAVDEMVAVAKETKADWVWANEMRVSDFCGIFPEYTTPKFFDENYRLQGNQFIEYRKFIPIKQRAYYHFKPTKDYRNFCLINQTMREQVGYSDVNYYPTGYYEDNDYCRRAYLMQAKAVMVENAWFFHFWSRSLFEGGIQDTYEKRLRLNELFYFKKWGGDVGKERFLLPFGEKPIRIRDRNSEAFAYDFWSGK